ncbi:MAG: hypothetical protein ABR999_10860 [Methanoregula sp.]|jgi:hypothetical protein|uniref:hypothetical protein n=1 Tax=Methanoregula sp. TaxID=2052170 RepID=UPI003D10BDFF
MPIALTKGLNQQCAYCGIAIKDEEIAGQIDGQYVDYLKHRTGVIDRMLFCSGCWEHIELSNKSNLGDAILKRKELEAEGAKTEPIVLDLTKAEPSPLATKEQSDHILESVQADQDYLKEHPLDFTAPEHVGTGI